MSETTTYQKFRETIKPAYSLEVDGLVPISYCIFDEPENDCFLWVSLDNNVFIKFYQIDNQEIQYNETGFYIKDEFGINFKIVPMLLISKE